MDVVDKIDCLDVQILALPSNLEKIVHIHAVGHVIESGWSYPKLLKRISRKSGSKTLEFSFVGDRPYGLAASNVVLPLSAHTAMPLPNGVEKVTVYAKENSKEQILGQDLLPAHPVPAHKSGIQIFSFEEQIGYYQDSFQPTGTIHWKNDGPLGVSNPHVEWKKLDHQIMLTLTSNFPTFDQIKTSFEKAFTQGVLSAIAQALVDGLTGAAEDNIDAGLTAFEQELKNIQAQFISVQVHDISNWEY